MPGLCAVVLARVRGRALLAEIRIAKEAMTAIDATNARNGNSVLGETMIIDGIGGEVGAEVGAVSATAMRSADGETEPMIEAVNLSSSIGSCTINRSL